jgi:hypothetical protein
MVNLFQILNQFVLLFSKNVTEKSSMIWRVLPLVKINTRIPETPCTYTQVTNFANFWSPRFQVNTKPIIQTTQ